MKFIVSPCVEYQKYNEDSQFHVKSFWHKESINASQNVLNSKERKQLRIYEQIDSAFYKELEVNRVKL